MHNGFLQVEGEKMSKSLGNFFTIRTDLLKDWPGEALRFNMLQDPLPATDGLDRRGLKRKRGGLVERWNMLLEQSRHLCEPEQDAELRPVLEHFATI